MCHYFTNLAQFFKFKYTTYIVNYCMTIFFNLAKPLCNRLQNLNVDFSFCSQIFIIYAVFPVFPLSSNSIQGNIKQNISPLQEQARDKLTTPHCHTVQIIRSSGRLNTDDRKCALGSSQVYGQPSMTKTLNVTRRDSTLRVVLMDQSDCSKATICVALDNGRPFYIYAWT